MIIAILIGTSLTMRYEVQDGDWAVSAIPGMEYKIAGNLSGFSELVYPQSREYRSGRCLWLQV